MCGLGRSLPQKGVELLLQLRFAAILRQQVIAFLFEFRPFGGHPAGLVVPGDQIPEGQLLLLVGTLQRIDKFRDIRRPCLDSLLSLLEDVVQFPANTPEYVADLTHALGIRPGQNRFIEGRV